MLPESLTICIIQFKPEWGEVDRNLSATAQLIASAKEKGSEVIVLPEMWPTGMYGDLDFHRFKEPIPGRYTEFLADLARRYGLHIVAGMPEKGPRNKIHNAAVLLDDRGRILAKHRKLHPYTFLGEEKIWTPGNRYTVVDTKIGRIGLLICYDGDFPESWRINALMGAEIVFCISVYDSSCEDWWDKFYLGAPFQNVLWAGLCNIVGDSVSGGEPLHFFGRSRIIAPNGEIVAEAPYVSPGEKSESSLLIRTIDLRKRFEEARKKYGNFLVDRRPELYGAIARPSRARKKWAIRKTSSNRLLKA